jgi:predicted Mrr-cat superfamily restriction endonuclease
MKYWLMRAGSGGIAREFCLQHDVIAMDWEVGDLSKLPDDLEAFRAAYRSAYPMDSKGQVDHNAATIHRFVHIMQIGDRVALSNAKDQWIYLGEVAGSYVFQPAPPEKWKDFKHQRKVKWLVAYPRTAFSEPFNASLKSELTLFNLDEHADELRAKLNPVKPRG